MRQRDDDCFAREGDGVLTCVRCRYAACVCCVEGDGSKDAHGILFCWGYGGHGNLGLGDRRDRLEPVAVTGQVCMCVRRFLCVFMPGFCAERK
jgi:hypothetical protein